MFRGALRETPSSGGSRSGSSYSGDKITAVGDEQLNEGKSLVVECVRQPLLLQAAVGIWTRHLLASQSREAE